jgi:hypothetical protein
MVERVPRQRLLFVASDAFQGYVTRRRDGTRRHGFMAFLFSLPGRR